MVVSMVISFPVRLWNVLKFWFLWNWKYSHISSCITEQVSHSLNSLYFTWCTFCWVYYDNLSHLVLQTHSPTAESNQICHMRANNTSAIILWWIYFSLKEENETHWFFFLWPSCQNAWSFWLWVKTLPVCRFRTAVSASSTNTSCGPTWASTSDISSSCVSGAERTSTWSSTLMNTWKHTLVRQHLPVWMCVKGFNCNYLNCLLSIKLYIWLVKFSRQRVQFNLLLFEWTWENP